ncbi:MAG: Uma2 family endonuclease [Capsulimonadales bacterium]|nr:Uma2 family endonuclease [Capsulimonadales bacterium]
MAVKSITTPGQGGQPFRWTREAYHRLHEMGFIGPEERTELIAGEIITRMGQNPLHSFCLMISPDIIRHAFGEEVSVRAQLPIALSENGEPEPDICVVRGRPQDFIRRQPTPDDVLLIVEVSDTTLSFDRNRKSSIYAEAGIADYWIINLIDRQVEVRRNPVAVPDLSPGFAYGNVQVFREGETVTPLTQPDSRIAVTDLLPPPEAE